MLTFGSLFAGIGGFDLGFERAGMRCLWQVEIDDYCTQVLEKHWPDVKRYRDVRECGADNLQPVDVICGGFPCQPFSHAGQRRGAADDRNLWPEYLRIINEVRPSWVVGENVPGIRTLYLDTVLSDLERSGYSVQTFNIPACAFDAPHRRERLWIVAHAESKRAGNERQNRRSGRREINAFDDAGRIGGGDDRPPNGAPVAHAVGEQSAGWNNGIEWGERSKGNIRKDSRQRTAITDERWLPEPDMGRVANGVPARVDRLRALGNAVVPQVAEFIGSLIVEVEHGNERTTTT